MHVRHAQYYNCQTASFPAVSISAANQTDMRRRSEESAPLIFQGYRVTQRSRPSLYAFRDGIEGGGRR